MYYKNTKEDKIASQSYKYQFDKLRQESWIDKRTRAVFMQFTTYNAQV